MEQGKQVFQVKLKSLLGLCGLAGRQSISTWKAQSAWYSEMQRCPMSDLDSDNDIFLGIISHYSQ